MSVVDKIEASMRSLREILSEENYYEIPDMQRDYQWDIDNGDKHGRNLWNSINQFVDEDPSKEDCYYLGTMIIYKDQGKWQVIDGQQRLTTLTLMYIAIRDLFDEGNVRGILGKLEFFGQSTSMEEIGELISKQTIGTGKNPKLKPKVSSKLNFKGYTSYVHRVPRPDFQQRVGSNKIRVVQAYELFQNEIREKFDLTTISGYRNLLEFTEHTLSGLAINVTIVKDMAQGYRIFSSENTTGLKLGSVDILRALILAQIDRKKLSNFERIKYILGRMMEVLDLSSQTEKNAFARYYWIQRKGVPMSKAKLSNTMSEEIRKLENETDAENLARDLNMKASIYVTQVLAVNPNLRHYVPHHNLTNCGFKQHRPLLLSMFGRKNRFGEDTIMQIFRIVEVLYVRFLLIGRMKGSTIEPMLAEWAKIAGSENISDSQVIEEFIRKAKTLVDPNFVPAFQNSRISDAKKVKYLLTGIEKELDDKLDLKDAINYHATQILPQVKGVDEWKSGWSRFNAKHFEEKIHQHIGNYCLLVYKPDHDVTTSWDLKKEDYVNDTTELAKNISTLDNWKKESIIFKTSEYAKRANRIWNLDNVLDYYSD